MKYFTEHMLSSLGKIQFWGLEVWGFIFNDTSLSYSFPKLHACILTGFALMDHDLHFPIIEKTTPVGCRGGGRYVEGVLGIPLLEIKKCKKCSF